jgi:hypothetical protein
MSKAYEERYCAFVDILGFRQLLDQLNRGTTDFDAIRTLLLRVHNPKKLSNTQNDADFRVQSISDAVAISTSLTDEGLFQIYNALEILAQDLLFEGFFVRGAIVKGKLYHDDQMVFGDALLRAYQLETETVRFPRIMVQRSVASDILKFSSEVDVQDAFRGRTLQASDGPSYLHILYSVSRGVKAISTAQINSDVRAKAGLEYYLTMKEKLQRRLYEAQDNPPHYEKVQWFADYWNRYVPALENNALRIRSPRN